MKHLWDILCRGSILTILLSSLLLTASAETISFCDSIPMQLTDWNSSVTLPKFDSEMGTLTGVDLKGLLNLSLGITMENKNPKPANYSVSIFGGFLVELPKSYNLSINVNHITDGELSGYDGNIDNSGPSGLNTSVVIPSEPTSKSYPAIDDFIAVSSGENITLPVNVSMNSLMKVPGNSNSEINLMAGAQVCISYTYEAKNSNESGSQ
jgi:hypothetical protein